MRDITFRTIGATAVLVGLALAALSQTWSNEPAPVEIVTGSTAATSSPTTEPRPTSTAGITPFEYRIGLLSDVTTDNFWTYYGKEPTSWNAYVLGATKPALYGIDPATNTLIADLSDSTPPPEPTWDANGWHVWIPWKEGLYWSDGSPITPEDMVFTFDTVRRLHLGGAWLDSYPPNATAMIAETSDRIRIDFDHRPGLGEWPFALGLAPVMPSHVWLSVVEQSASAAELMTADASADVSGGPLDIIERTGSRIVASVDHRRSDSMVDTVVFEIFDTEAEAADALAAGDIDTILNPRGLSSQVAERLSSVDGVSIERSPSNSVRYLGFNLGRSPMSNVAFRTAIAILADRTAMTQLIIPDALPAFTIISPLNASWFDSDAAARIASVFAGTTESRLNAARTVLEQTGYTWETPPRVEDGLLLPGSGLLIAGQKPAPLTILTPGDLYDPDRPEYARRIAQVIETLGFEVRVVVTDFDTVADLAFTKTGDNVRQYDMYLLGWTLGNPAYPSYYGPLFTKSGDVNSTGYDSTDFDRAWGEFAAASTLRGAHDALWRMESILGVDLPYLPLYHPQIVEAFRSDRIRFLQKDTLGGIQGRNGAIEDVNRIP